MRESRLWALHLVTAAGLLVLLSLHMGLMHYSAILRPFVAIEEPVLGFAAVAARDRAGIQQVLYALLLAFALYHGLYGARGVLQEIWSSAAAARVIDVVVVLLGMLVFVYGLAVIVQAALRTRMM